MPFQLESQADDTPRIFHRARSRIALTLENISRVVNLIPDRDSGYLFNFLAEQLQKESMSRLLSPG